MSSHSEASPPATCTAMTATGERCRKRAGTGGLCVFHSGELDLAAIGRKGGRARGAASKHRERDGDRYERLALQALEQQLTSGSATARSQAIRTVLAHVSTGSSFAIEAAKKAASAGIRAEMEEAVPGARDRLAILIDRRAAELAKELHEVQRLAERQAVAAEFDVADEAPASESDGSARAECGPGFVSDGPGV